MTIVAAWLSDLGPGQRFIECVSDSQVTQNDAHTVIPLLNTSAKLFHIPVIARHPGQSGFFDTIYHVHSMGLAFSGSSLIGLNLSSTMSSLTSQLAGVNDTSVPSLEDVCNLAIRITSIYVKFLGDARNQVPEFQGAVLGWCPVRREYRLIHFRPRSFDDPTIISAPFDLNTVSTGFLMGNHTAEIQSKITTHRVGRSGIAWDNAPKVVIEEVIRNRSYQSIGGGLQRGRGLPNGFSLLASCQPLVLGQPAADLSFRGLSLFDHIGNIGPCFVSMTGSV